MYKAKIAYRYCKSQNVYNARAFPYLFSLKEQTALPGTKLHTTLWLNLALMRDKWSRLEKDSL